MTGDVEAVCAGYSKSLGVSFSEPKPGLGNARTAAMPDGGVLGVRAPMSPAEGPVVRPYWLTVNLEAALEAAVNAGGVVAHPPMELAGHGSFAIYVQGGVHHGLWKN
ncbi:MAG: hydroxylase [Planctomycetota bacterium]|nr:hydroxylase [Planctomycetota bacterium]